MENLVFTNTPVVSLPFLIVDLLKDSQLKLPLLLILPDLHNVNYLLEAFKFLNTTALVFPAWDTPPYELISPTETVIFTRYSTLKFLLNNKDEKFIILTTIQAVAQKVLVPHLIKDCDLKIKVNDNLSQEKLINYLLNAGYKRNPTVNLCGEFAVKGSVVDIGLLSQNIRLDYFDDNIESIKEFDPITQLSLKVCNETHIFPVSELLYNKIELTRVKEKLKDNLALIQAVIHNNRYPGQENWLPLFYKDLTSLLAYLPNTCTIGLAHINNPLSFLTDLNEIFEQKSKLNKSYLAPDNLYIMDFSSLLKSYLQIKFTSFSLSNEKEFKALPSPYQLFIPPSRNIVKSINLLIEKYEHIIISAPTVGTKILIEKILNIKIAHINKYGDIKKGIQVIDFAINESFTQDSCLLVLADTAILGTKKAKISKKELPSLPLEVFEVGDLVVHIDYGIGRFEGLHLLTINNIKHDCLLITYSGEDKLYVPVQNIGVLSKYGLGESTPLDKLGTASWQLRKARAKQRIQLIADELMKVAATRKIKEGNICTITSTNYDKFCAGFLYLPTIDQQKAIDAVEKDLNSGLIMDRLICGDTGFGKTEVALRAAFLVVNQNSNYQVALMSPTTVLCRQHFERFLERFSNFPFKVKQFSRITSAKEQITIKQQLKRGEINIIIGTQSILNLQFKQLALVIVDEEQQFGVRQKEQLKKLQADAHLLSLSATPIPRTLQMSLTGIRDLSIISTPPVGRQVPKIFIITFDNILIKEAIVREINRGGSVFYVCPRISDLEPIGEFLKQEMPEVDFRIAHGQTNAAKLDELMNDFYEAKFKLLLTTTIIQAGVDIPHANTLIINNAELFGLGQLYQLRGRVGRSKQIAYVYFVVGENITDNAKMRLEAIKTMNELGCSFSLASYDMDIRGFGNLIGEKQSGKIIEVGVELYQKMLSEAISAEPEMLEVKINIDIVTGIPDSYVNDFKTRMLLYKRLNQLKSKEEINHFTVELIDRFGQPLPEAINNLLSVTLLQKLCSKLYIQKLDVFKTYVTLSFMENITQHEALINYFIKNPQKYKFKPTNKVSLLMKDADILKSIIILTEELEHLINIIKVQ